METLIDRVRTRLATTGSAATAGAVASALKAEGLVLGDHAVVEMVSTLRRELTGFGPLDPLLRDARVTDILVVNPNAVWIDKGTGLERCDIRFGSEDDIYRLAQRLAQQGGRRLDEAQPMVDASLDGGIRLHAVIPPVTHESPAISLRIPRREAFTLDELTRCGTIDGVGEAVLRGLIQSRTSFLICGGTGSGKTTVLASLLGLVGHDERIVIVEDSTELKVNHPHVVQMQARNANAEHAGVIMMRDLVRQTLRMRPDRIVVGEVRGPEIVDLLLALNTGHDGCCGTVHANSATEVPARLEALGLTAGLDREAVHALMAAGLEGIVHLERERGGVRRMTGLHRLVRGEDGLVSTEPVVVREGGRLTWVDHRDRWRPMTDVFADSA